MGRRKWGPTQAEQKQSEKASFMDGNLGRFNDLMTTYFLSLGHFVLPADVNKADPNIASHIVAHANEFFAAQRLVRDGGPLTGKRKEVMLQAIYAMEALVDANNPQHPLVGLYKEYKSARSWSSAFIGLTIVGGLIGLAVPSLWLLAFISSIVAAVYLFIGSSLRDRIRTSAVAMVSRL